MTLAKVSFLFLVLLVVACTNTTRVVQVPRAAKATIMDSFQQAKDAFAHICGTCVADAVAIPRASTLAKVFINDRIVTFDPVMVRRYTAKYGEEIPFVIFAHELGHSLDYLRDFEGSRFAWEISADEWSGCATAIAGLRPGPGAKMFLSFTGGGSHPPGEERAAAYLRGFTSCIEEL